MIVFWETNRLCDVRERNTHASFLVRSSYGLVLRLRSGGSVGTGRA